MPKLDPVPDPVNRLTIFDHWVIWRLEDGRKLPYQALHPTRLARVDDSDTWSSYDDARRAYRKGDFDGVGFVLTDTPYAALDLDNVRDPRTGKITAEAQTIIDEADSYFEITPSGKGLRIIGLGKGEPVHSKQWLGSTSSVECYRGAVRYITMTFDQLGQCERLRNIDHVIDKLKPQPKAHRVVTLRRAASRRLKPSRLITSKLDDPTVVGDRSGFVCLIVRTAIERGYTDPTRIEALITASLKWREVLNVRLRGKQPYGIARLRRDIKKFVGERQQCA